MRLAYPAHPDTVLVSFPDIPEALTEGATEAEALAEARDCLVAALGGYVQEGRAIPVPSPSTGTAEVLLSDVAAAKVALYEAARAKRLDTSALALRLGCSKRAAQRLLDVDASSRLHEVEATLRSLDEHKPLAIGTA